MKKFIIRFLSVLLAFQGVVAAQLLTLNTAQAAGGVPEVVINEVMWAGSRDSGGGHSADEWIELYNTTDSAIDLTDWTISNVGLSALPSGSVIPANGYFLIANYAKTSSSSVLNVDANIVDSSIDIPNTCPAGGVELVDATSAVVDQVTCFGTSWPAGVNNVDERRAMERNYPVDDQELWHTSLGFVNMDSDAEDYTYATPLVLNDQTEAEAGIVNDGASTDIDWTIDGGSITVNWSGFADPETGIANYQVGLGTGATKTPDFMGFVDVGLSETHTFTYPAELSSGTFYTILKVTNGAGVKSYVDSDGYTIDMAAPNTPTNLAVADKPADNGGSLMATWDASTSLDEITYQLNYRKVGEVAWNNLSVGASLSATVSGLENSPTQYEFTVEAIDFSNLHSAPSATVTAAAIDNLVPVLNSAKVVLSANKPGVVDSVSGLAGASNEPSTIVKAYVGNPNLPGAMLLSTATAAVDGSFNAMPIGDNLYGTVWLQLNDSNPLNLSVPVEFSNDVIAPNAPMLDSAVSSCQSQSCRVELHWHDNGPDTKAYQVGYVINGNESRSLVITGTSIQMDLSVNNGVKFVVYAFDAAWNQSAQSNALTIQLTAGVKTTTNYVSGNQVTTTEAIPGSKEVITAPTPSSNGLKIVPKAEAADSAPTSANDVPVKDANSQDWTRIFIVIILLLIVAGGFYSLSRSFRDVPADEPILPVEKPSSTKKKPVTGQKKAKKRRKGR